MVWLAGSLLLGLGIPPRRAVVLKSRAATGGADIVFGTFDAGFITLSTLGGVPFAGVLETVLGTGAGDAITDAWAELVVRRIATWLRENRRGRKASEHLHGENVRMLDEEPELLPPSLEFWESNNSLKLGPNENIDPQNLRNRENFEMALFSRLERKIFCLPTIKILGGSRRPCPTLSPELV